jgi:hypothetical protein
MHTGFILKENLCLGGNLVGKNNWAFFLSERDEYLHLLHEAIWPKIQEIS